MRVDLDSEQINFLNEKFGIKQEDIKKMNLEEWDNVRLKCFEIEKCVVIKKREGNMTIVIPKTF